MIKINSHLLRATCIEDLSHLRGLVSSDIYEERFPRIGKTYKLNSMYVMNERRDSNNRCIPRNPWERSMDIIKIHMFGWKSELDDFDEESGFDYKSFIYHSDPDKVYEYFLMRGINIRVPGFQDKIDDAYRSGSFKRKKPTITFKSSDNIILSESARAFDRFVKSEMSPGGAHYDKPYYDLKVVGGRVVEPGKERATMISIDL